MPEFFNVLAPNMAKELLLGHTYHRTKVERISTFRALGRITSSSISAPHDLPSFRRSSMDGYAVSASDTYGASTALPAILTIVGEVSMGSTANVGLSVGEAALIHTGGMIPPDADAVVQIEHTQIVESNNSSQLPFEIEVFRPVAVGQNLLMIGEDVLEGSEVLPAGHYLRAQDVGGLLALGITEIQVYTTPTVAIIATGDEIVEPTEALKPGQIRDINSYTIASLVSQNGGAPNICGVVGDKIDSLLIAATTALHSHDMLVITAGSSVSARDMTVQTIDNLGEPGVLLHGVATRPGKPTVLGAVDGKPILGLPGNPVSAMVQFLVLGVPAIFSLQGATTTPRRGSVRARVNRNVPSASGREDYVPARLIETNEGLVAEPVFGKSNLIYTLVKAGGLVKIPINQNGLEAGEWVEVLLF
jgi:molybdopterin molybdotransferase